MFGEIMVKMIFRILLVSFLIISSQLLQAQNSVHMVRLNSTTYYSSYGPGTYDHENSMYNYYPESFYQLESIIMDISTSWGSEEDTTFCQTQVTHNMGLTTIDTNYHQTGIYNIDYRIVAIMDSLERNIAYRRYNQDNIMTYNKEIYYRMHSQPDSIIINSDKWVYHYDELGRKSIIDHYTIAENWTYNGYYAISYTEPLPYILDLNPTIYDYGFLPLFDATWKFSSIIFYPIQAEPDTLRWNVVSLNPVEFNDAIPPNGFPMEVYRYVFSVNGNLVESSYYSNDFPMRVETYNWDNVVSNEDEVIPVSTLNQIQNYPNPFKNSTTIKYNLQKAGHASIKIYNTKGQLVKTLADNLRKAGENTEIWNGDSDNHEQLSSGVYFIRLQAGHETKTSKVLYIK